MKSHKIKHEIKHSVTKNKIMVLFVSVGTKQTLNGWLIVNVLSQN